MTYKLILELPEQIYEGLRTAAEQQNQTPSEWIVMSLSRLLQEGTLKLDVARDLPPSPLYVLHESAVSTGVRDLADQHDHYLYGSVKRDGYNCLTSDKHFEQAGFVRLMRLQ